MQKFYTYMADKVVQMKRAVYRLASAPGVTVFPLNAKEESVCNMATD